MLPSMPLLMTPMKKSISTNKDSESSVCKSQLTVPTNEGISVHTAETDQCLINTQDNIQVIHTSKEGISVNTTETDESLINTQDNIKVIHTTKEDISVNTTEADQCLINTQDNIKDLHITKVGISVNTPELEQCLINAQENIQVKHTAFSPPIVEIQNPSNKKNVSPRQLKGTTRQRAAVDCGGKKNETQQKQNLVSLLMPVKTATGVDVQSSSNSFVGQCMEISETPDIEKLMVDIGQHAESNPATSPQQFRKGEGGVRGKHSISTSSRRSKKQRELEAKIAALKPETSQVMDERAANYAHTYFMKVKERVEETVYAEFVQELVKFKDSNSTDGVSLYRRMESLLAPHKDLIDEFLAFLTPDQTKQIGRLMDYLLLVKMKDFINKLEVLLAKQCQPVYASLEQLTSLQNVSMTDVHNAILPHLKSSSLLTDYFLELLPGERPPDSLMIDYEQADCLEGDEDSCYEMVHVPDYYDPYGGEHCPCKCHETQSFHCVNCGIKYINGRVYLQHGKIIRSAKVTFEKEDQEEMLQMKWRGRGEPEIGFTRYHRRQYFPSPVKDHSLSIKKSPRTPRARSGTTSKRNLKTAKGNCSSRNLPLIEGIMPLVTRTEFSDVETEIKNDTNVIRHFGDTTLSKDTVSEEQQCLTQHSPKAEAEVSQVLYEAVEIDLDNALPNEENIVNNALANEENIVMEIEEEDDIKSPTCSQITDVPSILSPMSFFSESFHSNSGFELINKQSTNSSPTVYGTALQPLSFSEKLTLPMDDSKVQITASSDSSENTYLQEFDSKSVNCNKEIYFAEVKAEINHEILSVQDVDNKDNTCKLETISEPMDESTHELQTNIDQPSLDIKIAEEISNSELNNKVELQSNLIEEGDSALMKIKNENCVTLGINLIESSSQMSDQKKTNIECSQSSVVVDQRNAIASDTPCWTREEDKIILQAFQLEGVSDQTFIKINQLIPSRTVKEIQKRFQVLLQLLQQMTGIADDVRK